ncbi:MAG: hypothetical protein OXT68_09995 [Chloroflexota bacterium]|nr:hypothetical protein [Chloroflexota bacterium]
MLSSRLWRQIAQPDTRNPIFRRASQSYKPASAPERRYHFPRPLLLIAGIALIIAVALQPQLLILLFAIPILMIMLVVASPALLPLFALVAGLFLTVEIIAGITREKRQHTYELICSSTPGSLYANWSFAKGAAHRGGWFAALRWGSAQSLRLGGVVLGGALLLILWLLLSGRALELEQLRLTLLIALLLLLYHRHLTQTVVLGALIGLFSGSFDLGERDAGFIGICLYIFAQGMSIGLAGLFCAACGRLFYEPHTLVSMGVESVAVGIVILCREALIVALWRGLRARLELGRGELGPGSLAAVGMS